MHVIGTAGHVDHGKSTLIKALTGIDPDRLREEKERQMTIDLGFAWLDLPSGEEIGIVDVPGHRDFVDNMLAGAGGIDAVLFIIAADEGIMPQSREHLAILKLLEIKTGLIVLTKTDLVDDPEWLDLVRSDIRQFVKNSFLSDAPIIAVSAVNGDGLQTLIEAIDDVIQNCEPRKDIGRARLPVDRVFSIKGFGTVVTGTMLDGSFSNGQQVEILPSRREARIRGLQSHKRKLEKTEPGSRAAVNLSGVDVEDIQRGNVLAQPGIYSPTDLLDVRFSMITDANGHLKHNDEVKLFCGTAQSIARVRLIKKQKVNPGENAWLQLELKDPIVAARSDHYILRRPSPAETIGGGVVLDPHPDASYKRFSENVYSHFEMLETGTLKDRILELLNSGQAIQVRELTGSLGVDAKQLVDELENLLGNEIIVINSPENHLSTNSLLSARGNWENNVEKIMNVIRDYHIRFPLRVGISKNELKEILNMETDRLNKFIEGMSIRGLIYQSSGLISLPGHQIELTDEDLNKIDKVKNAFLAEPYSPPSLAELKQSFNPDLIDTMIANHLLVQTSDDIAFRKEEFDEMARKLVGIIHDQGGITLSRFRDTFKTSRKYALSFLEYLDKRGVTSFDGEKRIIRDIDKLNL